jgi:hypothetical protein
VLENPIDTKQQLIENGLKWFQPIDGTENEGYEGQFNLLPVKALTTVQNTPEWFLL